MPSQPSRSDYKVPKISQANIKVPPGKGGNTDIKMRGSAPIGAQKNRAANPDFQEIFDSEKDLQALLKGAAIRSDKARLGAALAAGERRAAMKVKVGRSDDRVAEKRGPDNAGVRGGSNKFDNVRHQRVGTAGTRQDGKRGRW